MNATPKQSRSVGTTLGFEPESLRDSWNGSAPLHKNEMRPPYFSPPFYSCACAEKPLPLPHANDRPPAERSQRPSVQRLFIRARHRQSRGTGAGRHLGVVGGG